MSAPRVVAIGGGHGLATTLRAVQPWAGQLTAVVSTADDGGSSGRLRASWEVPALGDARRCLSALAGDPNLWARALERRFDSGELSGHVLGNLLLLALMEEIGDLQSACDEVLRMLGLDLDRVRIVPVTDDPIVLMGRTSDGTVVEGQVAISSTIGIEDVWVTPTCTAASHLAIDAIRRADLVVLGPGSLFTSVLAAAMVGDVRRALLETSARIVYVSNLHPEPVEARDYGLAGHVEALARHGVRLDLVVTHTGALDQARCAVPVMEADVARAGGQSHDPDRLGRALATSRA